MVPYADFNLLKFPDKEQAMAKIKDLTCLSDIFPTGFHGAVLAGVGPGSTVYIAGAGPVGTSDDPSELGVQDYVIIAVKAPSLVVCVKFSKREIG
jgi:glutathione-independent formaldehyde dehydrogenase